MRCLLSNQLAEAISKALFLFSILTQSPSVSAWSPSSARTSFHQQQGFHTSSRHLGKIHTATSLNIKQGGEFSYRDEDDNDSNDEDWNKVKVPRRGGRRRRFEDDPYYDDISTVAEEVTSGGRNTNRNTGAYYDVDEDEEDEEDEYDEDSIYDDINDEDRELMSNVVIPNPLLDAMDPDGAAERFPEMAQDPRFWLDLVLFIAVLNFLSWAAPRDPYPDLPIDLW
mmetsp:Transcript_6449/g.8376  ORF Transcript_6449/g.8376 Transcript_6449/m.8376 type:complete len:225 (-) Transcript_6449:344-1018(-)|eukprot:CAMPEP_0198150884 /NCGR_PEP_ID=MMETSP1443-20131203/53027_1 /TAXON_ID=186043 /ORGANISM="Entomoneis sp., Strain CCMP2396" /LENGTH=224 /DNA_ID=CAMNT_0043816351 /DNA_START=110 /DNA_END=784 /DNA_ORIENTATION=-